MRHFPGPGGGMYGGGSLLWGFLGFIGTLVVLTLIAVFVIFVVKKAKRNKFGPGGLGPMGMHHRPMPPALQILDERLARGEIEVEDYMTRKAALLGGGGPATNEWTPPAPTPAQPEPAQPEREGESAG